MACCLALLSKAVAQNVLGIDFGSEFIKLAIVQRSAGVQVWFSNVLCHDLKSWTLMCSVTIDLNLSVADQKLDSELTLVHSSVLN